jgi:hypothetical protein
VVGRLELGQPPCGAAGQRPGAVACDGDGGRPDPVAGQRGYGDHGAAGALGVAPGGYDQRADGAAGQQRPVGEGGRVPVRDRGQVADGDRDACPAGGHLGAQ